MEKVIIVTHRSQASELLEALQREGICHILNAEEAMVSKDAPELITTVERPRDIENILNRLTKSIEFLKAYAVPQKGIASMLAPRTVIDNQSYNSIVSDEKLFNIIDQAEQTQIAIDQLNSECENLSTTLNMLTPWASLETPVEEIGRLQQATCLLGLIPSQHFEQATEQLTELGAALQRLGTAAGKHACIIVSMNENINDIQKLLRSAESEPVNFEGMTGTVADLIKQHSKKLSQARNQLQEHYDNAHLLSENLLNLQILQDHYTNLLNREQTRGTAPATEYTVLLEGWVKKREHPQLEKIVSCFEASNLSKIEPAEDEEIPVEIENTAYVRPFESITRLYGMPQYSNVDPTIVLAPFFAIFFALCLTDAAYGLILIAIIAWLIRKIQGDKKMMWMFIICSAATVVAGALTGGWFGDAIQQFIPALKPLRAKVMWFDPLENPMMFFKLSLALGYIQVIFGICVALMHNLKQRLYIAAVFDQVTWLVMLNSLALFGLAKTGVIPSGLAGVFGPVAVVPALAIVLFSERDGGWGQRLGMGAYNLFSTVFFVGDILSYARLMALGMVTAGFGMAVNVIVAMVAKWQVPVLGFLLAALIFIVMHLFNVGMSLLSAFVHTLRLQFVEFFPKFFVGGGRTFEPLTKSYKHVYINEKQTNIS
ncbi:MAG: V-type ATP synthase subunit I [Planctomycetota bacterium]